MRVPPSFVSTTFLLLSPCNGNVWKHILRLLVLGILGTYQKSRQARIDKNFPCIKSFRTTLKQTFWYRHQTKERLFVCHRKSEVSTRMIDKTFQLVSIVPQRFLSSGTNQAKLNEHQTKYVPQSRPPQMQPVR